MKNFFVKNGKVEWLNERELVKLPSEKSVQEIIKDMTPEQFEAFKKERYEKFIKPLMNRNIQELESKAAQKETPNGKVLRRKSWIMDPGTRNDK